MKHRLFTMILVVWCYVFHTVLVLPLARSAERSLTPFQSNQGRGEFFIKDIPFNEKVLLEQVVALALEDKGNSKLLVPESVLFSTISEYVEPISDSSHEHVSLDILAIENQHIAHSRHYSEYTAFEYSEVERPSKVHIYRSTTALPLFYKDIGLDDETAPLPFTIMLFGNYMQTKVVTSNFQGSSLVQDISFGNISFGDFNMPLTGFADIREVEQRFVTGGARFAVNVLPFWSVYGILACSTGSTKSAVNVKNIYMKDVELKANTGNSFTDALINGIIQGMGDRLLVREGSMPFVMDFDAFSTGIGTTLAIGGKLFFTTVDTNYVITSVESAQIMIHTINASARVGMHKTKAGQQMAIWLGASYMENIVGSKKLGAVMSVERLSDLFQLDGLAQSIVGNKPADIKWSVNQKPLNVFSALVGLRYSPKRNFDIVTEVGFIDRVNVMVSAAYNF
ncbi:MAG: hypothetical protein K2M30_05795 [Desulfovibrionaceae bacterium]|nr:hypothetical protein [Desulfovibrionaceae bacterium]